jgi:hypothetical protein
MANFYEMNPGDRFEVSNSLHEYMVTTDDNIVDLITGDLYPIYKFIKERSLTAYYEEHHFLVEEDETGDQILVGAYVREDVPRIAWEELHWGKVTILDELSDEEADATGLDEI